MKLWPKHPLRVSVKVFWLAAVVTWGLLTYLPRCVLFRMDSATAARSRWLQDTCRRTLRIFGVHVEVSGPVPTYGFMVCNHLSYMDILVISSCTPVVFVAKHEVGGWPVFGWFARLAGTLFVHRESRTHVGQVADEIEATLARGALVVLFPEGTSSDGQSVLPFKSSLLEPVARNGHAVTAALIGYQLADGDVGEEVCYWKDMTLVPHLLNLMSKVSLRAMVRFQPSNVHASDRKELARQLHAEVSEMLETARR